MESRALPEASATAGLVAGVVVLTRPGCAAAVRERLSTVPGLTLSGDDGDARIAAVWHAESGERLESLGEELVALDEEILGIHPTFVAPVDGSAAGEAG